MANLVAYVTTASNTGDTFSNATNNDFLVYTQAKSQNIHFGATGQIPSLTITSNSALFNSDVSTNSTLIIKGLQIMQNDGISQNVTQTTINPLTNDNTGTTFNIANNTSNFSYRFIASNTQSNIASLTGDGNFTLANNISAPNIGTMRNRIINGDMRIDQRNAGNSAATFGVDRFKIVGFSNNPTSVLTKQVTLSNTDLSTTNMSYANMLTPIVGPTTNLTSYMSFNNSNYTDAFNLTTLSNLVGTMRYGPTLKPSQSEIPCSLYLANEANMTTTPTKAANQITYKHSVLSTTSYSFWLQPTKLPQTTGLENTEVIGTNTWELFISYNTATSANLFAYAVTGTSSIKITLGAWYHVVIIFTPASTLAFYVNGSLIQSISTTAGSFSNGFLHFGDYAPNSTPRPFAGYIDDFRIYNRALTTNEISLLSSIPYSITSAPTNSLAIYYPFDGNANDSSGNGNTLTATGTIRYTTGLSGYSLYLANETNVSSSQAPTNYLTSTYTFPSTFTVSLWAQPTWLHATNASDIFITTRSHLINSLLIFYLPSSSSYRIGFFGGSDIGVTFGGAVGRWVHLCATYTNGIAQFYFNGQFVGTITGTLAQSGFMFGSAATTTAATFAGYIDEFRLYTRILSPNEVAFLANNATVFPQLNLTSAPTTPAAYFQFENNLTDSSGNNNTLSTTGSISYGNGVSKSRALYLANEANVNAGTAAANTITSTYTFPTNFSVAMWVYFSAINALTSVNIIFNTYNGSASFITNGISIFYNVGGAQFEICFDNVASSRIIADPNPVGKWLHFAITYTPGTLKSYFNGAYIASLSGTMAQSGFRLGNRGSSGTAFAGYIDDFRIYDRVLSDIEVANLVIVQPNIGAIVPSIPSTNIISNFSFDGNILDSVGNIRLTATGTMSYVNGITGSKSLYLINEANVSASPTSATNYLTSTYSWPTTWSVSFWVQTLKTVSSIWSTPFTTCGISTINTYAFVAFYNNAINFGVNGTNGPIGPTYAFNTWYHLTLTYNGSALQLYINGNYHNSLTCTPQYNGFIIGNNFTTGFQPFAGYIDDFRIYNTALNQSQVTNLYYGTSHIASQFTPYSIPYVPSSAVLFQQSIEGNFMNDFEFGTTAATPLTLSCWVKNTTTTNQTFCLSLNNNQNRSYLVQSPVVPANTWQKIAFTLPGDTIGTWAATSNIGLNVALTLAANSNVITASSNTWQSNLVFSAGSNITQLGNSANLLSSYGTILVTSMQLEQGTLATPFEYRPFQQELQLCKRYYEKSYDYEIIPGTSNHWNTAGVRKIACNTVDFYDMGMIYYSVPKRAPLSNISALRVFSTYGVLNNMNLWNSTSVISVAPNTNSCVNTANYFSYTLAAGNMTANNGYAFHWVADVEL